MDILEAKVSKIKVGQDQILLMPDSNAHLEELVNTILSGLGAYNPKLYMLLFSMEGKPRLLLNTYTYNRLVELTPVPFVRGSIKVIETKQKGGDECPECGMQMKETKGLLHCENCGELRSLNKPEDEDKE